LILLPACLTLGNRISERQKQSEKLLTSPMP